MDSEFQILDVTEEETITTTMMDGMLPSDDQEEPEQVVASSPFTGANYQMQYVQQ